MGGSDGSGYAQGIDTDFISYFSYQSRLKGIFLNGTHIDASGDSQGGDVTLKGKGWQGTANTNSGYYPIGIDIVSYSDYSNSRGTKIITNFDGEISLDGIGGNHNNSASHNVGINLFSNSGTANTINTNQGNISITAIEGTDVNASVDAAFNLDGGVASIFSSSGSITITGTSDDSGLRSGATMNIGWDGTNSGTTGDISIIADKITATTSNGLNINSSGQLSILSQENSFSGDLSWPLSNLSLSGNETGLTIGKSTNTSKVLVENDIDISGPISIYGGDITVSANISSTLSGADILFKASENITVAASKSISTNGGDISLWANSDGELLTGGYITLNNTTSLDSRTQSDRIANDGFSNDNSGGAITLGGGNTSATLDSGTLVPTGYALKATNSQIGGIQFGTSVNAGISLTSGGGDILLKGKSTDGYTSPYFESNGILFYSGISIDAGSNGNITIDGQAENGKYNAGFYPSYTMGSNNSIIRTRNGHISIKGESLGGSSSGGADRGIILMGPNDPEALTIESSGTGNITLIGNAGTGSNASHDFWTQNTVNILAASGNITLEGRGNGITQIYNYSITMGRKANTNVTSSSSDIEITDNKLTIGGSGVNINTSGSATIKPYEDDFSSNFTTSNITFSSDMTGLTIGKDTNTSNVTVNSNQTVAGPISIYAEDITLSNSLTASGTLLLQGSGATSQSAAVSATTLSLQGSGTFTLNDSENHVESITAGTATQTVGNISFTNKDALSIGVGSKGILSSGTIQVGTLSGNLTISDTISTTNNSSSAIKLYADQGEAADSEGQGNIYHKRYAKPNNWEWW